MTLLTVFIYSPLYVNHTFIYSLPYLMIRKNDMVKTLASDLDITKVLAEKVFDNLMGQMKQELMKGSDVIIPQFFILSVKKTMGRTVVVPSTGVTSEAKEYKRCCARFSKKFRDEVKHS